MQRIVIHVILFDYANAKRQSKTMNDVLINLVPIISLVIALAAVVISPFVSWKIAKRQINASNVSSKRQVWIDDLRRDVAEVLAVISRIQELKRPFILLIP